MRAARNALYQRLLDVAEANATRRLVRVIGGAVARVRRRLAGAAVRPSDGGR